MQSTNKYKISQSPEKIHPNFILFLNTKSSAPPFILYVNLITV